jgi:hypothetical protein
MRFRVKSTLAAIALAVFFSLSNASADSCRISDSSMKPFRLGMTVEDVRAIYPAAQVQDVKVTATQMATIRNLGNVSGVLAGADYVSLSFTDGRLVSINAGYKDPKRWHSLAQMQAVISKAWGLPARWPRRHGTDAFNALFECDRRALELEKSQGASLYFLSLSEAGWAERDAKRWEMFGNQVDN